MSSAHEKVPKRRRFAIFGLAVLLLVGVTLVLFGDVVSALARSLQSPPRSYEKTVQPRAPDYASRDAWMAYPGQSSLALSTPPGIAPVADSEANADVFFIHPTTYLRNDVWNAAYDAAGEFDKPVLLNQASVFNGCCRIFAPRYRQASLKGLKNDDAVALAYSDVARAFEWYIERENKGRPFIIASHSQGTGLAVRLLQEKVIAAGRTDHLVAAYAIGAYVPSAFADIGLPVCDGPSQTGCVIGWNSSQQGRDGALRLIEKPRYWWDGAIRDSDYSPAVCVNPLTWTTTGKAAPRDNPGSLPMPDEKGGVTLPMARKQLPEPYPGITGAQCNRGLLDVTVPRRTPKGFHDVLSLLYGSYHRLDYGLFYSSIRANAIERANAWEAAHRER